MGNPIVRLIYRTVLTAATLCWLATVYYVNIEAVSRKINGLQDFGSFIAAGQFSAQANNPYSPDSPLIFSVTFQQLNHTGIAPNLNPPISVLIFEQIAGFDPAYSVQVWRILSVVFYLFAFYYLLPMQGGLAPNRLWRALWAIGLAGFWHTIELGQVYTFLLLLTMGIYKYMEGGGRIPAGILLGLLIAIKPNFIFWAAALLAAGYWTTFLAAGITALLLSLPPLYYYGFIIYEQWFEASQIFTPDLLIFPGNNSLQGLAARFDSPETGVILSIALAAVVLIVIYKNKPPADNVHALGVISSLLISPIAWTGYTILLLPYFMRRVAWKIPDRIAAAIFAFPFYIVLALFQDNIFNFVFFGWFYGWGLTLLFVFQVAFNNINLQNGGKGHEFAIKSS